MAVYEFRKCSFYSNGQHLGNLKVTRSGVLLTYLDEENWLTNFMRNGGSNRKSNINSFDG